MVARLPPCHRALMPLNLMLQANTRKILDCRVWTGKRDRDPPHHPLIRLGNVDKRADHLAYVEHYGPIPPGHHVLRRCEQHQCIEPTHLFASRLTLVELVSKYYVEHPGHKKGQAAEALGISIRQVKRALSILRRTP